MKREKNVFHLVGVLCLAVALQFFPASTWAETNVFPIVNQQSTYTVTGNIVDGKGEPIIGANVVLKGSATGVVTDVDGNFSMSVSGNDVLMVSYIGYNSLEIPVKGQKSLNIVMKENVESLDEIVVIGYGTMKKKDLICTVCSWCFGRAWEYMEIPLSGGKVRRWNFFTDLYHFGIDLWIFYDRGRDSSGTYDKEKSGRCVWNFW